MRRTRIPAIVFAIGLIGSACQGDGIDGTAPEPGTGRGQMGIHSPGLPTQNSLPVPEDYPCRPATGDEDYGRYGPGRMRRGGLEPEKLERDHIVVHGEGMNFHGVDNMVDGGTIEMEMDDDYFEPSILVGAPGATVTLELENEGVRAHNLFVPGQDIDLRCGVRARDDVEVTFPTSGVLVFRCRYTATSGMRGALRVA